MLLVSSQCNGSSAVSFARIIFLCLVQHFLAATLFVWPSFTLIPSPLYFPINKSVLWVPGSICVGAHD